ncbi:hypothetical protein SAM19_01794 [Brevibacillus laterosporus]|nr:hypothetical protein [Brevibacillus laterosporus]
MEIITLFYNIEDGSTSVRIKKGEEIMKILSVIGESVPAGKGGSPADTFERSVVIYQVGKETKTLTVTYVRYFEKLLAQQGVYDQEKEGVPVNQIAATLFLEQNPQAKESRHYFNDAESFTTLFTTFSIEKWKERYSSLV